MVQYKYDAWGNCKVLDANGDEITDTNHIGQIRNFACKITLSPRSLRRFAPQIAVGVQPQRSKSAREKNFRRIPFRYRGYYYETNTGLYYLQSRFYDPETGRFINADTVEYLDPETVNGLNLYAYCGNNPVMYSDPSGHFPWLVFSIIAGILILGGGAIGGISAGMAGGSVGDVLAGIGKGAINGLVLSAGVLLTALGFYVGITSIAGSALAFYIKKGESST